MKLGEIINTESGRQEVQEIGKQIITSAFTGAEQGDTGNAAAGAVDKEVLSAEQVEQLINDAVAANVDRYGNAISAESVQNLQNLAQSDPGAFTREVMALTHHTRMAGEIQGYAAAQTELAELLDGRAPAEFLQAQGDLIEALEADLAMTQGADAKIVQFSDYQQGRSAKAVRAERRAKIEADLAEAKRQYALVDNLQKGETAEPVLPQSAEMAIKALDAEGSTYETESRVRRADIERALQYFASSELRERILGELTAIEAKEHKTEQQDQSNFATPEEGVEDAVTDDDIRRTAEEAGGSTVRPERTQEQADREYRHGMMEWARAEAKTKAKMQERYPGWNRFGDVEEAPQVSQVPQVTAEERARQEYYQKLQAWAEDEAKTKAKMQENHPGWSRFGDAEVAPATPERQQGIRQRFERIRERLARRSARNAQSGEKMPTHSIDYGKLEEVIAAMSGQ